MAEKCCPDGNAPALNTSLKSSGVEIDLDGLKCYTNGSGVKSVIVFYDVFGFNGGRTRLICDQIAAEGYYAISPDIYHGDAWPDGKPMDGIMDWLKNFPWNDIIKTEVNKVMDHLQKQGADQSIGCLGFCAGAYCVFHLCQNEKMKCGASCHPSVHIGKLFGETPEDLASGIKCPQLLYPAGGDLSTYKPGGEVVEILQKKFGNENVFREFPDMIHGFVSRGDINDPKVAVEVKQALDGVFKFFSKHV